MVSFDVSEQDADLIQKIVERAFSELKVSEVIDRLSLAMDITACHANGNPLDLQKFLEAEKFTFAHDVYGIMKHIDRKTGKLEGLFVPRCVNQHPYTKLQGKDLKELRELVKRNGWKNVQLSLDDVRSED